jgi:hypothetical protein
MPVTEDSGVEILDWGDFITVVVVCIGALTVSLTVGVYHELFCEWRDREFEWREDEIEIRSESIDVKRCSACGAPRGHHGMA